MALTIQPTRVFWCEPTSKIARYLRCYTSATAKESEAAEDPCKGYCNARNFLDSVDVELGDPIPDGRRFEVTYDPNLWPWDAFPTQCEKCGREMVNPMRQIFTDTIYCIKTGPRAGEEFQRRDAPVGAMWNIDFYNDIPDWCGRDGLALMVITPGGEWHVDGMANNCTRRDDHTHRCWVRRGDPRTGYCHVDKDATVQETCEAGAGSIWINQGGPRDWHGFLYRGYLIDADDSSRGVVDRMLDASNPVAPAERVLKPVESDLLKVRRAKVSRPAPVATQVAPAAGVRRWRSNR